MLSTYWQSKLKRNLTFTAILSACICSPAQSQSIQMESVREMQDLGLGPGSGVMLEAVRPDDIEPRLALEGISSEFNLSQRIAARSDANFSTVLRELTTRGSLEEPIKSSIEGFDTDKNLVFQPGFNLPDEFPLPSIDVDNLIEIDENFENNLRRELTEITDDPTNIRVWNGLPVTSPDIYPDALWTTGNGKICSGVLVDQNWALSAAHCFCGGTSEKAFFGTSMIDVDQLVEIDQDNSTSLLNCANYSQDIDSGDIAILKLKNPITEIEPRKIASIDAILNAASVRSVGVGRTEANVIGFKYMVDIVIASHQCETSLYGVDASDAYGCAADHELVAAGLNRDTCGGDSGGPSYILDQNGNQLLATITSRAVDPTGKCGPGGISVIAASFKDKIIEAGVPASAFQ